MSTRIEGGISTRLNPNTTNLSSAGQNREVQSVGQQVQQVLFGKPKPIVLDPAKYPQVAEQLKLLRKYKKKIANMADDNEQDYDIALAQSTIAMIDAHGTIYMGLEFLMANKDHPEIILGALAHEIGHQPKRWKEYKQEHLLSKEDMELICRHEETRADIFAGTALAELGLSCEPMIEFLQAIEEGPHPEYFPAETRGEIIREAHQNRYYRQKNRRKIFPEFDRMTSIKGHLGEF
ncbi:MAG: hypothetical protein CMH60_02900 [Myxococcales bacterium]|nr:hypothetical protein [Myxococcales bacterium]